MEIMEDNTQNTSARVYESRYRPILEQVRPPSSYDAAKTMSLFEIKRGLRGTWPKVPLILAGFIVFGFLTQLTTLGTPQEYWIEREDGLSILASISIMLTPQDGPGAIIIIHIAIISAGLISGDLRDRAIDLYYSKIKTRTYFISKIVASIALAFIGLPLFVVIYYLIAVYKRLTLIEDLGDELAALGEVFWKMSVFVLVITIFLAILALVFSAYTSNPINAGVMFLVFSLVSRVFFESILFEATQIDLFYAFSPFSALDVIRREILAPDELSDQFFELSVFSLILYTLLSLVLVWMKLRGEKNQ